MTRRTGPPPNDLENRTPVQTADSTEAETAAQAADSTTTGQGRRVESQPAALDLARGPSRRRRPRGANQIARRAVLQSLRNRAPTGTDSNEAGTAAQAADSTTTGRGRSVES